MEDKREEEKEKEKEQETEESGRRRLFPLHPCRSQYSIHHVRMVALTGKSEFFTCMSTHAYVM